MIEMNPKVSILIPCYNVEKYLNHCVESVITQTYTDLEIILADDGSRDGTAELIQSFMRRDPRVIGMFRKENLGVSSTRNEMLDHCTGDYILFIDSDDWIDPEMVRRLVDAIDSETDIVMCDYVYHDGQGHGGRLNLGNNLFGRDAVIQAFLEHKWFRGMLWNKLFPKNLVTDVRFDITVYFAEDALFVWQLVRRTRKVKTIPDALYHYQVNQLSACHAPFSPRRATELVAWKKIASDVHDHYPSYNELVDSQLGFYSYHLLYEMYKQNYVDKDMEANCLSALNDSRKAFFSSHLFSMRHKIAGFIILHFKWVARVFFRWVI